MRCRVLLAAFLSATMAFGHLHAGRAPALAAPPSSAELKRLLDLSWEGSTTARQSADELFARLRESHPADESLTYAQALAKIKQRKYPEASALIDELAKIDPVNPDYLRPRIWLAVLLRKPEPAVAALNRYIGKFPPAPAIGEP